MSLPRVLCLTTGGTIAAVYQDSEGGLVAGIGGADLVANIPGLDRICDVEVVERSSMSSTWFDPQQLFMWADELERCLATPAFDGAVVVTGTETLEEAAYLFDLMIAADKPVVFTGAMRAAEELLSDGPRNLRAALAVASSQTARGLGVLVVLADEIHTAHDVSKLHADSLCAFSSPGTGPIGTVQRGLLADEVVLWGCPLAHEHLHGRRIEHRVALVKAVVGADAAAIDAAADRGARGIVIEAFPAGGITPEMAKGVERALAHGVVVVVASRAPGSTLSAIYGGVGEGRWLRDRGVLFAHRITAPKARLKLMLTLGLDDPSAVSAAFEGGNASG